MGESLLLNLSSIEGTEGESLYGDDLEAYSRDISDGMSLSTKSGHKDLIILIKVIEATILRDEAGDLLSILL